MRRLSLITGVFVVAIVTAAGAAPYNGAGDYQRGDLGYYYAMTGGKFPTGNVPNGDNASGGTFRYLIDEPAWGAYPQNVWNKDDWFTQNASLALTLMNGASIVYDNNGLEDASYGSYYDATGLASSTSKPGLYRGYSMSNNFDWIYAGYFKLEEATTVTSIIGYFDANSGFNPASPEIAYDMNIWSAYQDNPQGNPNSWMPVNTGGFEGDVFSAKATPGTFAWSDTGVDRIFGDDYGNVHDDILRLTYTLAAPITLQPGVYFFSHDAEVVPEPGTVGLLAAGLVGIVRRRRRA